MPSLLDERSLHRPSIRDSAKQVWPDQSGVAEANPVSARSILLQLNSLRGSRSRVAQCAAHTKVHKRMRPNFVVATACEQHFSREAMLSLEGNVGLFGLSWNLNTGNDGIIVAWLTM